MKITEEIMKPHLEKIAERVSFILEEQGGIRDINRIVYEFGEEMLPDEIKAKVFIVIGLVESDNRIKLGYMSREHFQVIRTDDSIFFCTKEHWDLTFGNPNKPTKLLPIKDLTSTN